MGDPRVYDCIVVGIGGHGSASLAYLAKSGLKVLGLEQFKPVHKHGSSHGRTRIYRQAYYEDPKYVPLLQRSLELFRELDDYYVSELRETPDHEGGIGRLDRLLEMSGAVMMRELYPTFHLSEDEVAVHEDSAGYLMAELCVESYIALARKHGAELHFEEPMLGWKPCLLSTAAADDGANGEKGGSRTYEGVEVRTARGVYRAKKLVLSCDEDKIADFNTMPVYIWDLNGPGNFYGFPAEPTLPGQIKVAFHFRGDSPINSIEHPDQVVRTVAAEEIEAIRTIISKKFPGMNNKLLRTETCMYTSTDDNHFVLDFHPRHKNVLLVSPCSGHGFKFISVVGEIVSELIGMGRTQHDISLFSLGTHQDGSLVRDKKKNAAQKVTKSKSQQRSKL